MRRNLIDRYFNELDYPHSKRLKELTLSQSGLDFIKGWEGFYPTLYNDGNLPNDPIFHDICMGTAASRR